MPPGRTAASIFDRGDYLLCITAMLYTFTPTKSAEWVGVFSAAIFKKLRIGMRIYGKILRTLGDNMFTINMELGR
jgi:hypothetical protein